MSKIRNTAVTAGAVLALGVFTQASAGPLFTVDPTVYSALPGAAPFQADLIAGVSSALVTQDLVDPTMFKSEGWIQFTGFLNNGTTIGAGVHGVTVSYGLHAEFEQTFSCALGLGVGQTCSVTGINLSVYADPGYSNTFANAMLGGGAPAIGGQGNDDLLATANIVLNGVAGLNAMGGAFENVNTNIILTGLGMNYFVDPDPFYNLAFRTFTNTSQGIQCFPANCVDVSQVAITQEVGATDFNADFINVPEPTSLALIGLALAGMGVSRRRKVNQI